MVKEWKIQIPALTGRERRRAWCYVPDRAFAEPERRFPVLYMFDGQNLFRDADASYGKSWGLLSYLTAHDIPLIVAAVECNHHAEQDKVGGRLSEYSPFDFTDTHWGDIRGRGALTMDYFVNVFKPHIDAHYPTNPDRGHTFIAGSSMGGLMTLYALAAFGDTYSRGAALSPSLMFSPKEVRALLKGARWNRTVLYMDVGSDETGPRGRAAFADTAALLMKQGALVTSRIVPGGKHSEASWEQQIPFFLNTLLYELKE